MKRAVSSALSLLAFALVPGGIASASTVEEAWRDYLTGSRLTHTVEFQDQGGTNTLFSHYYLCSNGRFVHKNEIAGGGAPPMGFMGPGTLKPMGTWQLQFVQAGNTTFANLVLASAADPSIPNDAAAFRTYRLEYSDAAGLQVDQKSFKAKKNDETGCAGPASPFTVYSPLQ